MDELVKELGLIDVDEYSLPSQDSRQSSKITTIKSSSGLILRTSLLSSTLKNNFIPVTDYIHQHRSHPYPNHLFHHQQSLLKARGSLSSGTFTSSNHSVNTSSASSSFSSPNENSSEAKTINDSGKQEDCNTGNKQPTKGSLKATPSSQSFTSFLSASETNTKDTMDDDESKLDENSDADEESVSFSSNTPVRPKIGAIPKEATPLTSPVFRTPHTTKSTKSFSSHQHTTNSLLNDGNSFMSSMLMSMDVTGSHAGRSASKMHAAKASKSSVTRTASILLRSKALILSDSESDENSLIPSSQTGTNHEASTSSGMTTGAVPSSTKAGQSCSAVRPQSYPARKKVRNKRSFKLCDRNCHQHHYRTKGVPCALGCSSSPSSGAGLLSPSQVFGKRKRSATMSFSHSGEGLSSIPSTSASVSEAKMDSSSPGTSSPAVAKGASNAAGNDMDVDWYDSSSFSESSAESDVDNTFAEADDEQSDWYGAGSSPPRIHHHHHHHHHHHKHNQNRSVTVPIPRNPFATMTASSERSERSSSITGNCSSSILWKKRRKNQWS